MAKILISTKFLFFTLYTASVSGTSSFMSLMFSGSPPLFFYFFGMTTVMMIPLILVFGDVREWILKGNEKVIFRKVGDEYKREIEYNVVGFIANVASLVFVMQIGIGYLNQNWFPETVNFTDMDKFICMSGAFGMQIVHSFIGKIKVVQ